MWTHFPFVGRALGAATAIVFAVGLVGPAQAQAPAGRASAPAKADQRVPGQNAVKDGWITVKIHSQFVPEDALEGSDIDVTTKAGVVTLTGAVPSEAGRARAIAVAKATDGVKSVTDSLRIMSVASTDTRGAAGSAARKAGRSVNDGWIKSKIYAQFLTEWNTFDDSNIDIDVTNGAVALNGTVKSDAARARAGALAKTTDGVKSVKDNLKVSAAY